MLSEKPIKDMSVTEIHDFAQALYELGYSRKDIRFLTDNRISERQIRKFYKEPQLKEKHTQHMKEKQQKINSAVRGFANTEKTMRNHKLSRKEIAEAKKHFKKQQLDGLYSRNHPKHNRYHSNEGSYLDYIEEE